MDLRQRCCAAAGWTTEQAADSDAFVGFFQRFRPDGIGLAGLYDGLPRGAEYQTRLAQLFLAAGDDRRPGGGRDAYFVIRRASPISAELAEHHAVQWLESLHRMALRSSNAKLARYLDPLPKIRVLEGIPPKQLKSDQDTFELLHALKVQAAVLTDGIASDCQVVSLLRQAYYFTACDPMLRDYLLWPAYVTRFGEDNAMAGYFELWRHGVKWRVFGDAMLDLYLPRV